MARAGWIGLFAVTLAACSFKPNLEQGVVIACAVDLQCPAEHVCDTAVRRCASKRNWLEYATVTPDGGGVGQLFVVELKTLEVLSALPTLVAVGPDDSVRLEHVSGAPAGKLLTYTFTSMREQGEGEAFILADVTDARGEISLAHEVARVRLDSKEPVLTAQVSLHPAADNPLADVGTQLTWGTVVRLEVQASEELADEPSTVAAVPCGSDGGATFQLAEVARTDFRRTFAGVLDGGTPAQGCHRLEVTLRDRRLNAATTSDQTIFVDTVAPAGPHVDDPGAVVYRRVPGAQFTLRVAPGAVDEQGTLLVYAQSRVASAAAGPDAGVPLLVLAGLLADAPQLSVAFADPAGNSSPLVKVRDVEWVGHASQADELSWVALGAATNGPHQRFERLAQLPATGAQATAGVSWRRRDGTAPDLTRAAFACDEEHGECVLFGGVDGSGVISGKTWRWDGDVWTELRPTLSPRPRRDAAAAFDGQRIVMIGGADTIGELDDVWEWNGASWTRSPGFYPGGPVSGHAMAYDAARRRLTVAGGGDVWERDPQGDWTQGPSPDAGGHGHSLTYDPQRRRELLFGGPSSTEVVEFDGTRWTVLVVDGGAPPARVRHGATYEPATGTLVVFGGVSGATPMSDCWTLSAANLWTPCQDSALQGAAVAAAAPGTGVLLAHGRTSGKAQTTRGRSWLPVAVAGPVPAPRAMHAMVGQAGTVLLTGGDDAFDSPYADTYQLTSTGWELSKATLNQGVREHAMVSCGDQVWLVGGETVDSDAGIRDGGTTTGGGTGGTSDSGRATSATFMLSADGGEWRDTAALGVELTQHSGGCAANRPLLFGGSTNGGASGETYVLDGGVWKSIDGGSVRPTPRVNGAMASLSDGGVLIYGGRDRTRPLADLWSFGALGWVQAVSAGVTARHSSAMTEDRTGAVVLFGGHLGTGAAGDTWEWRDGRWALLNSLDPEADGDPAPRYEHAMALSPWGTVMLFGGTNGSEFMGDGWELRRHQPSHAVHAALDAIGVLEGSQLGAVDVRASVAGDGGATLAVWADGKFLTLDAGAGTLAESVLDPSVRSRLTLRRELSFSVKGGLSSVRLDSFELELHYRLPPGGP